MPFSLQFFQHLRRMTAVSQCCIQSLLSRLNVKKVQNLIHTDRNMHPRRCSAFLDDFGNGICILFRIQLFVFFFIISRMCSGIPDSPFMFLLLIFLILHNLSPILSVVPVYLHPEVLFLLFRRAAHHPYVLR